jgi:hypothetical protein
MVGYPSTTAHPAQGFGSMPMRSLTADRIRCLIYLDANLAIKEEILAKTIPINAKGGRYRPDDDLLAFLKGL